MLIRTSKRLLTESLWPSWLLPSFLVPLPTRAYLTTVSHTIEAEQEGLQSLIAASESQSQRRSTHEYSKKPESTPLAPSHPRIRHQLRTLSSLPTAPPSRLAPVAPPPKSNPLVLSTNLRTLIPLLKAQPPHYITLHIHGKGYLVQQGDTIRLPFLMPDVSPGDRLRLNCASTIGSRDFTLKAGLASSPSQPSSNPASEAVAVAERQTTALALMHRNGAAINNARTNVTMNEGQAARLEYKKRRKLGHLDDRLFVCRATVMGVEAEPLRIMEKTKPRQRHIRHVRSKHRYTVLRISELRLRGVEELLEEESVVGVGGEEGLIASTRREPSSADVL